MSSASHPTPLSSRAHDLRSEHGLARIRALLFASGALLAIGCGDAAVPEHRSPPPDAVADAAAESAPFDGDVADAHVTEGMSFRDGPEFPYAIDHHATFIHASAGGAHIYVAGGARTSPTTAMTSMVMRAKVAADGSIGAWADATSLPGTNAAQGVAVVGDRVYLSGGKSKGEHAHVWSAGFESSGALTAWRIEPSLPSPRFHHSAAATPRFLYSIGGAQGLDFTAEVLRAEIGADGALGAWQTTTPLPLPRSHHASIVHKNVLYVSGGTTGSFATERPADDVLRAVIHEDGSLGPFQSSPLPDAPATHSNVILGDDLVLLGGFSPADHAPIKRVRAASIAADGTLGAFRDWAALPHARSHRHQTPVHEGRVYLVGGRDESEESTSTLSIGTTP